MAILEALAVTAEVCGTEISKGAALVMEADLSAYPEDAVLHALTRVRREHKGRLSLAAILERLPDERPGAEEAWGMLPKDERDTAVLTEEINRAAGIAGAVYLDGDKVGARMAFREAYTKIVADNKAMGIPVKWVVSLGWDKDSRVEPIADAVKMGRITAQEAFRHLGSQSASLQAILDRVEAPKAIGLADLAKALEARK